MGKKILLVDDAQIVRMMLKDILVPLGYEIVGEACDGNEGVQKYKQLKPDLVTMDIVMPDKDGIEALKEILEFDPNAKVIMVTAIDQKDYLKKAITLGAFDYIVKPFEDSRVAEAIEKSLINKTA